MNGVALIGHTGFVGQNLLNQVKFDVCYNSTNFQEMTNQQFETVVCTGISAVKWLANKEPDEDKRKIEALQNVLKTIKAKNFYLISTIDVYPVQSGVDENYDCHLKPNHAYGINRLDFENFCSNHFENCLIIRLPALFGQGLKKNVIFDLLNDNCLEMINVNSSFQYYDLSNLWLDIQCADKNNIKLINFFTEPIATQTIVEQFFPNKLSFLGNNAVPEVQYDLYSRYANIWGNNKYLYNKKTMLEKIESFIALYKRERCL